MEADMGLTTMALDSSQGEERLFVEFYLQPVQNKAKSMEEGRPIFEEKEYVRIIVPGDKDNIIERPAWDNDKSRFPRHYQAFKNRTDQSFVSGTPLSAWPVVSRAQVEEMNYFGVKTVEQLAEMPDSNAQRFAGINTLRQRARDFLAAAKDEAIVGKLRSEIEERDGKIEVLEQSIEALKQRLDALEE